MNSFARTAFQKFIPETKRPRLRAVTRDRGLITTNLDQRFVMTIRTLTFLLRKIDLDHALEISIATLFLGTMAYGGWTIAGLA